MIVYVSLNASSFPCFQSQYLLTLDILIQFGRFMTIAPLKYYFNVNNSYVMNKMRLLVCPFFHKVCVKYLSDSLNIIHLSSILFNKIQLKLIQQWKRRIIRVGEVDSYAFPREDINAPDLYIPTMAFVTYILLVGFVFGTISQY